MNKFKLGILIFALLGFASCSKDDGASTKEEEEIFTEPLIKEATNTTEGDNSILIKLVGSGFGTRSKKDDPNAPYAPLLSSDFEHDNNGAITQLGQPVVESLSEWADKGVQEIGISGYGRRALFSDVRRNAEESNHRSIKMTHVKTKDETIAPVIVAQNLDFKKTRKIFFSYWVKFKWPNENPDVSYQYKLSTVVTDVAKGGTVHGGTDMQLANWMYPSANGPYTQSYYRNMGRQTEPNKFSNTIYFSNNTMETTTDNWRNIVLFWDPGTPDKLDGKFWSWISKGPGIPLIQKGGLENFFQAKDPKPMISTYDNGISDFPNSIKLAWYISKLSEWNVDTYFDDIVADNSWAQIFVGDKPNFDDCSTLELQQVADWQAGQNGADDVAQFKLRYGSLSKDQPLYVYIMNEGGLYNSAGFRVLQN